MSEWHPKGNVVRGRYCPKCRRGRLVYNGNYFCERWGDGCDWAMSERNTQFNNEIIKTYLLQERADALAEGDQERVERMEFYLAKYADKE